MVIWLMNLKYKGMVFFGVSFARFVIEKKNIYLVMCMYGCGGYLGTLNYYFFDC